MSEDITFSERVLSQGQGDRFDRWVEFFGVLVMSAATVLTAWCGYQAALWGGDESRFYFEAIGAQSEANQQRSEALQVGAFHASLFVEYATAVSQDNNDLSDFLYDRFPPVLKTATDAWLATAPMTNPDAPPTPFEMPSYQLPQLVQATKAEAEALEKYDLAQEADEIADSYILYTVIFATVLFFSGISGKFQWQVIDAAVLVIGTLILFIGLVNLLSLPVQG